MESSNAHADVPKKNKSNEKSNQPIVSPVPDLVPSVSPSSNTVTVANSSPVKANSPKTSPKKAAVNNGSTPTAKSANPAAGVKSAPAPSSQPVSTPASTTPTPSPASTPASTTPAPPPASTPASTTPAPPPASTPASTTPASTPAPSPATTPATATAPAPAPRATSLPSAASEASVKNRTSREEKSRKKDDKSVDHVLRALNSLNTTEEKLAAMCKKYADIFDEHRKLQLLNKQTEKRCSMLQREKEQLQGDHSKAILTRSRLENLCRELQRQNKAIKDESLLKIREEEEKRKEVSAKFQTTMNEITTLMQQNNDKNMKLRDDNIDMTTKLKNICEQYEIRQQQVERISKQMQLEQQLADAKLGKLKMEMAAERETLLREKQQLLMELQQYQQRCTEFQATEVNLRNQISMYNDKYDEFQKALARSNDVFGGFKGEMEKMSKKICKLEKETSSWKQRWERSHNALLEMAADKQKSEQELAVVSRQLATLQGLCRTLQTERSTLLAKLKGLQAGSHEPIDNNKINNSNKQFDQSHNHIEQTVNHLANEPQTNSDTTGDPVLDQYTQDILASFKESDGVAEDKSSNEVPQTPVPTINQVPVQASPLPDVVGVTNPPVSVLDNKPDVNNALNQRVEQISLNSNSPVKEENSNIIQPSVGNQSAVQENSVAESVDQPSVIVPNPVPQVVLNGEAVTNGLPQVDPKVQSSQASSPPQPQPPKSPTKASPVKSTDSGKKAKDSGKKKKK